MKVLIIGSLAGDLGQAARIAISRGAKLDQALSLIHISRANSRMLRPA